MPPDQTITTLPLTITLLAALWGTLGRCLGESPWAGCDNGKVLLDADLPKDAAHWDCPTPLWPQSQRRHSIDTVYDPEFASLICMDKPITYNHTIPNSGAYRPVGAESGEYLYCPPQRWLNNLHHGATVLLYHPCTPLQEHQLLSALAQSCINEYIITPHKDLDKNMPIALVSWGRTLEVSTVASSEICDWLQTTSSTKNNAEELRHKRTYNLLMIKSADSLESNTGSLKQCCEQTISTMLNEMKMTQLYSSFRTGSMEQIKERERRAAIKPLQNELNQNKSTANLSNKASDIVNKLPGIASQKNEDQTHTQDSPSQATVHQNSAEKDLPVSNISRTTMNTILLKQEPSNVQLQTDAKSSKKNKVEAEHSKDNLSARTKVPIGDAAHSSGHSGQETVVSKLEGNEVIDVEEREADHRDTDINSQHKIESNGVDTVPKSPVGYIPNTKCECKPDQPCDCIKSSETAEKSQSAVVNRGLPRTPRTDEAVWAAAALGFLLVLLTLSILHTRLYRHWRIGPSLYWRDPQQDYDSVADVIRRRLRLTKRRRKRGRRPEIVLVPSSSSSEEYP